MTRCHLLMLHESADRVTSLLVACTQWITWQYQSSHMDPCVTRESEVWAAFHLATSGLKTSQNREGGLRERSTDNRGDILS